MGCFKKLSGGSSSSSTPIDPRNPNPFKFTVVRCLEVYQGVFVSEIKYPNCTNYEGNKVLLSTFDPRRMTYLDPHFQEGNGLIARYLPTPEGWEFAVRSARILFE